MWLRIFVKPFSNRWVIKIPPSFVFNYYFLLLTYWPQSNPTPPDVFPEHSRSLYRPFCLCTVCVCVCMKRERPLTKHVYCVIPDVRLTSRRLCQQRLFGYRCVGVGSPPRPCPAKCFSKPNELLEGWGRWGKTHQQFHSYVASFEWYFCVQRDWAADPRRLTLVLKRGSTGYSASRDTCTRPACCGESPSRSPSTSSTKTTADRLEYDAHRS